MDIAIALILGLVVGALLVLWIQRGARAQALAQGVEQGGAAVRIELATLQERLRGAEEELQRRREALGQLDARLQEQQQALLASEQRRAQLQGRVDQIAKLEEALAAATKRHDEAVWRAQQQAARIAELETALAGEQTKTAEKIALLQQAEQALTHQFKTLANDILEEKSKRFQETNQASVGALLQPLREQIEGFKTKVEQTYEAEARERHSLRDKIEELAKGSARISQEADNLVRALKGDNKAQGNWGEMILEQVLERSGLRKGQEYEVQVSVADDEGKRQQPDVVVHLPEDKRIVIDAKVSLVAYERFANAETSEERQLALKEHIGSLRAHLKGLSAKAYHARFGVKSVDFVLMFIPIEPAFMAATTGDRDLFQEAWSRDVVLVSPSTLLAMLRTIAAVWRQEDQSQNAQKIAQRGAELYDRLVGFVGELQKVGQRLGDAQAAFAEAQKKLSEGRGNVIRQAEMLKELGVKPGKALPAALVDASGAEVGAAARLDAAPGGAGDGG